MLSHSYSLVLINTYENTLLDQKFPTLSRYESPFLFISINIVCIDIICLSLLILSCQHDSSAVKAQDIGVSIFYLVAPFSAKEIPSLQPQETVLQQRRVWQGKTMLQHKRVWQGKTVLQQRKEWQGKTVLQQRRKWQGKTVLKQMRVTG